MFTLSLMPCASASPASDETAHLASRGIGPKKQQALILFRQAKVALDQGNVEEAHRLLLDVWRIEPNFEMAANLGAVELELEKYADAANHLTYAFENVPASQVVYYEETFGPMLDRAKGYVGQLTVNSHPRGAEITIDGQPAEASTFLMPGRHHVSVRKRGYLVFNETVEIAEQGETHVEARLIAVPSREAQHRTRYRSEVMWLGGGLTLALAATALTLDRVAASGRDDLDRKRGKFDPSDCAASPPPTFCQAFAEDTESVENQRSASVVFGISAGLALTGTVLTTLLWTERIPITAALSPQSALLKVHHDL
jgi:hypothetical protein